MINNFMKFKVNIDNQDIYLLIKKANKQLKTRILILKN